jgi:hypothetical protein
MDALAAALQDSALSQLLRSSIWLYPLVNIGHVVGIALLFGAIVPLDLRLMGFFRRAPLEHLANTLVPVAATGLVIALSTGSLLFATRPLDYVGEPLFGIKLGLLGAALVNALVVRYSQGWRGSGIAHTAPFLPAWRVHGLLSIVLWLGAIATGRLIGYR